MSILNDIYGVDNLINSMKDIRKPEDLQNTIQSGKDIFDKYITDLKNIPAELERWQDVAKDLGILSENTDFINEAKDIFFREAFDTTKGTFLEGKLGLENLMSSKESLLGLNPSKMSIGGVTIDYVYNPNPEYETNTVSQPIISSSNIDNLSEHAENNNPTLSMRFFLKGDDRQSRFDEINQLRETKQIIQVITNQVYDRMIITRLKPRYNNTINGLEVQIELENVFIAQLQRTASKRTNNSKTNLAKSKGGIKSKGQDPFIKNATPWYEQDKPIPEQQKPFPTLIDMTKGPENLGFATKLKYKSNAEREMFRESYIGVAK